MIIQKCFKFSIHILLIIQFHSLFSIEKPKFKTHLVEQITASNNNNIFKDKLHDLITKNVIWARSYIIAEFEDSPNKAELKQRLLKNQKSFSKMIMNFYGNKSSEKLAKLLQEHKKITVDLIEAAKENNQAKMKKIEKKWYLNIKDLAIFINQLNPKLSINELTKLLNGLLKLTKQEIVLRSQKKWKEDIQNFDKILDYASHMANNLSSLIAN